VRDLQDRFPQANLMGGDREFEQLVSKVVGARRGSSYRTRSRWTSVEPHFSSGSGMSYGRYRPDPSRATLTSPSASDRRVGSCRGSGLRCQCDCCRNTLPRVVRNDGALSGYRWGIDRKRALLEREAAAT